MKKITKLLIFVVFIWSFSISAQIQIGDDISFGDTNNNFNFGKSVSISSDGSKMVTSYIPINGSGIHEVRVFENINGSWIQLGQTIYGDITGDGFGTSVTMSSDGTRIAVYSIKTADISFNYGHVRIYQFNGTEWIQLGSIISGENSTDTSGSSMSFSNDGLVIALGAPDKKDENGKNVGYTRVYTFVNNEWQQMGQNIIGGVDFIGNGDKLGESVSISSNGYRLLIGGSGHYRSTGVVRAFDYNEATNIWEQMGSDIVGERIGDMSGSSISISNDGLTVAIGAHGNDENGFTSSGQTRVYKYSNSKWVQVGQDIDGEKNNHAFGTSVSLSGDGKEFVSGVALSRSSSGFIKIYKYSEFDGRWVRFNDIVNNSGQSSQSISLSKDGASLIFQNRIGALYVNQVYKVNFNDVSGKVSADFGNNGCLSESIPLEGIKVSAVKGDEIISTYTEENGSYSLLTSTGTYNIIMDSENKYEYLDFTQTKEITFDDFGNIENFNICIISNITIENELEVDEVDFPTTSTLSFNKDGSVFAFGVDNLESLTGPGYVEVYDYINDQFIKKGATLIGDSDNSLFGTSISLSSSGNRIAIGAPNDFGAPRNHPNIPWENGEGGEVKVYDYIDNSWVQVGQNIQGVSEDNLGRSISLSADGKRLGIGVPMFKSNEPNFGRVEVYELINGIWVLLGEPIRKGSGIDSNFGAVISLSADGNHIAVSESERGYGALSNKVRIFKYNEVTNNWEQMGDDLTGINGGDFDSARISLSEDGNIIAIGAHAYLVDNSYVRTLQYDGNKWIQIGSDFINSHFGSMSNSGDRIVISKGDRVAKVYDFNGLNWDPFGIDIETNNYVTGLLEISGEGNKLARKSNKIYMYNLGGNAITGRVSFDNQNNDCSTLSIPARNLRINTINGDVKTTSFTNEVGFYKFSITNNGIYNVFVDDSRFNISPNFKEVEFVEVEGKKLANFCVSTNIIENDVIVTLLPISEARPGFNAKYQIVYENQGTVVGEGSIIFKYDNTLQSFVSSTESLDSQSINTLTYNYNNLSPFESRTIDITLKTEPPTAVNGGDILPLSVVISSDDTDIDLSNNVFEFNQTVVNSFDPNDKQVLQGSEITIENINNYLHYLVRFQNTGTASAINVRIRDVLDDKLDWDTFSPISSSHSYITQITEGNLVDFIFDNVLLPAEQDDEPNSHGFVAFKIKAKSNVQLGDVVTGEANIYFDYNSPITTNTVSTEIVDNSLGINDNRFVDSIRIYPNPTNDIIYLSSKILVVIEKIEVYSISGKLLFENNDITNEVDLKRFPKGMYFMKIISEKGNITKKIIKK